MSDGVQEELKQYFRPEFLNRLDEIIVFQQLNQNNVRQIADIMINQLCKRVKTQGINLDVKEIVKDKLSKDGFNPVYGARPLRRVIMSALEDRLASLFLEQPHEEGTDICVDLDTEQQIKLTITGITPKVKKKENLSLKELEEIKKDRRTAITALKERKTSKSNSDIISPTI